MSESTSLLKTPSLPLRDVIIYPYMVVPLFVGRQKSIEALERAMQEDKQLFLVAQKDAEVEDPNTKEIYKIGTLSTILQLLKLPDGTVKVLIEGQSRAKVTKWGRDKACLLADVQVVEDIYPKKKDAQAVEAMQRSLLARFNKYVKLNKKIPMDVLTALTNIEESGRFADTLAAHLMTKVEKKQEILEKIEIKDRLKALSDLLDMEIDLLMIEENIQDRVKDSMATGHRVVYLSEKIKASQEELRKLEHGGAKDEMDILEQSIEKSGMPKEAKEKATSELNKLKMMSPMSAEATVVRNYLDWLIAVPWKKASKINHDLSEALKVLESDHYGLEKVKERIIEYLAVQQRVKKIRGPILCLVGPPGVGKTSLGQSIARATGREFIRQSLGGVRDEAEIRGHRRTYIGSQPGCIVQNLSKKKVKNPVFMLDEIDKMTMDFRGDPSSALLEVLDPEQNFAFRDHYLEVDYDLSDVMFIATANSLDIPSPLLDRMEVIRLAGYTEAEKMKIAEKYLVPKQIQENGLKKTEINISSGVIEGIIRHYTREAGVRSLERSIAKICRKVVKEILVKSPKAKTKKRLITSSNLENYLGVKPYRYGLAETENRIGQVTGLAWTEVGGDLLSIEAVVVPGKGESSYTGSLGEVMQESIEAATMVIRSRAAMFGIDKKFFSENDMHVHLPEGATPKDGPSAGAAMCTALLSTILRIPVRSEVAMTGEITLRGEILPIGGLKEKLLAALRGGIKTVLIPEENRKDLKELPKNITQGLDIHPVKWIDEVLDVALEYKPVKMSVDKPETEVAITKPPAGKAPKKDESDEATH